MKSFLAFALVAFATVTSLFAQAGKTPTVQDVPTLQEWWRADNMWYARYGMTWLDNFYDNKGALVIYTPSGVKTWRLSSPGDTQNIFTWSKGSANIKAGDFNGDKVVDYVDENNNVYEGIANGQPPKSESIASEGKFSPWLISDINADGFDDIIHPGLGYPPIMNIVFGSSNLMEMKWVKTGIKEIDSNNRPAAAYMVSPTEMRVLCRSYYWHYNKQEQIIDRDGYRLVRVWWDGSGFQSQMLDEFTVNIQDGTGLSWLGALLRQPNGKIYWLGASQIQGQTVNTDLTVYDLSNNKLDKLYTIRNDRIAAFGVLGHSIDGDSIPDWCIVETRSGNTNVVHFYNGKITENITETARYTTCQYMAVSSIPDRNGDSRNDVALAGKILTPTCFAILLNSDSTVSVEESSNNKNRFSITCVSPMPCSKSQTITLKATLTTLADYQLVFYNTEGQQAGKIVLPYHTTGEYIIPLNLNEFALMSGTYLLRLESNHSLAQCLIIVE